MDEDDPGNEAGTGRKVQCDQYKHHVTVKNEDGQYLPNKEGGIYHSTFNPPIARRFKKAS